MKNPVWPSSCVTPAGTSNELDVQNEWEENTENTHTNEEETIPPPLRSRGVFIVGFPPTRPSPLNTLELSEGKNKINDARHAR